MKAYIEANKDEVSRVALSKRMKYVAIIYSDDELSEDTIKNLKDTLSLGDEHAMITSIKKAPEGEYRDMDYTEGYNQALRDCGVLEE